LLLYVDPAGRGATDRLLSRLADRLITDGVRPLGVVQNNVECTPGGACDMDAYVLPDGPVFRISQSLGPGAKGCRLDAAALEAAVAAVEAAWTRRPDLLIVNKFGKHEAGGRGFRDLIARAVSEDIPVVTGVNRMNRDAFLAFTGPLATPAATELDPLLAQVRTSLAAAAA